MWLIICIGLHNLFLLRFFYPPHGSICLQGSLLRHHTIIVVSPKCGFGYYTFRLIQMVDTPSAHSGKDKKTLT